MVEESYLIPSSTITSVEPVQPVVVTPPPEPPKSTAKSRAKRPKTSSNSSPSAPSTTSSTSSSIRIDIQKNSFWRVNYDKFSIHFRTESCVDLITEKYDAQAGLIIKAAFLIVEPSLTSTNESVSTRSFAVNEITDKIGKSENPPSTEDIINTLEILSRGIQVVTKVASEKAYLLNIGNISNFQKQRTIESIIHNKFGMVSARIFRLLMSKKTLRTKANIYIVHDTTKRYKGKVI